MVILVAGGCPEPMISQDQELSLLFSVKAAHLPPPPYQSFLSIQIGVQRDPEISLTQLKFTVSDKLSMPPKI